MYLLVFTPLKKMDVTVFLRSNKYLCLRLAYSYIVLFFFFVQRYGFIHTRLQFDTFSFIKCDYFSSEPCKRCKDDKIRRIDRKFSADM